MQSVEVKNIYARADRNVLFLYVLYIDTPPGVYSPISCLLMMYQKGSWLISDKARVQKPDHLWGKSRNG